MSTEYCDRYTFKQIYGHYPPEDGSLDPALSGGEPEKPVVEAKVVAPMGVAADVKTSQVAETKTPDLEVAEPAAE